MISQSSRLLDGVVGPFTAIVLCLTLAVGAIAQNDRPQSRANDAPQKAQKAQKVQKDAYSGKTVKSPRDGMGLIRARGRNAPRVGSQAPDFALKTTDGKKTVTLSKLHRKKPVVLVFGSFT